MMTGPPFERLYAVEPDGVATDHPVARGRPRFSPPSFEQSSIMRPGTELVTTTSLTAAWRAVDARADRAELDDAVVAGEGPGETFLQRVARDAREEADPAEVHADDGHAATEEPVEGPQHRPVAAEGDREVERPPPRRPAKRHARGRGYRLQSLQRVADHARPTVGDDRHALDPAEPTARRSSHRSARRGRPPDERHGGRGRTPGSPSAPEAPES